MSAVGLEGAKSGNSRVDGLCCQEMSGLGGYSFLHLDIPFGILYTDFMNL